VGDYETASPSETLDLPQTIFEPILVRYATAHGFKCRSNTRFLSFSEDKKTDTVMSRLHDRIIGQTYSIRSKYLFGADGARSQIMQQLEIPLLQRPALGWAINALIDADLTNLMEHRPGNLHWILQPDADVPDYARITNLRMVKPWTEWIFIMYPKPRTKKGAPSEKEYIDIIHKSIGDNSIPVKIKGISFWDVNDTVAEYYSWGHV
jgi:2-polyprenyl-6-methoxyphenol hydroxylase-like FAD-dependent oxidoreductase